MQESLNVSPTFLEIIMNAISKSNSLNNEDRQQAEATLKQA